jgi:hypothetical protein
MLAGRGIVHHRDGKPQRENFPLSVVSHLCGKIQTFVEQELSPELKKGLVRILQDRYAAK